MSGLRAWHRSVLRELEYLRDHPWELALATWVPLALLALLAWLLSAGSPRGLPIAVVDDDGTPVSRQFIRLLEGAPALNVVARPADLSKAWSLARSRKVYGVVYIPFDTARELERQRDATVFAYFNASFRTAGQAALADISAATQALRIRLAPGVAPPLALQSTVLFNSARSYERYLVGLLHPAVLHFVLCLCIISAFGREIRDGTAGQWLGTGRADFIGAIAGKATPYLLAFTFYSVVSTAWLSARGTGVAGSLLALTAGQFLMYVAYAGIGVLLVAATKSLDEALAIAGIYAGTSLAFSDGTFAVDGGVLFTRVWNALLPYNAYLHVQREQFDIGSRWLDSGPWFAVLLGFVVFGGGAGLALYARRR